MTKKLVVGEKANKQNKKKINGHWELYTRN